jgi:hypothetical protein
MPVEADLAPSAGLAAAGVALWEAILADLSDDLDLDARGPLAQLNVDGPPEAWR